MKAHPGRTYHADQDSYIFLWTNSTDPSGDKLSMRYMDGYYNRSGGLNLWFNQTAVKYQLVGCGSYKDFPTGLPTKQEKEWMIEKRGYQTIVHCNGRIVLNVTASVKSCDLTLLTEPWTITWERDVYLIKFPKAGNSYNFLFKTSKRISGRVVNRPFFPTRSKLFLSVLALVIQSAFRTVSLTD